MAVAEPKTAVGDLVYRIKQAVVQKIINMNLVGGTLTDGGIIGDIGKNVYSQLYQDASNIVLPAVIVTTAGEMESNDGGSTMTSNWWRPVRVFIADRATERRQENEAYYLWWRKQIMDGFLYQRLGNIQGIADVTEVRGCEVIPQIVFDPLLPQFQFIVSGLILKFYTAEKSV